MRSAALSPARSDRGIRLAEAAYLGATVNGDLRDVSGLLQAIRQATAWPKVAAGHSSEVGNRPQTLYALMDSPVGLAAWMLDHDDAALALIIRVFDGEPEGLTRDDILDNVTLYWLTNTGVSSARLYWESKLAFFAPKGVKLPTGVSVFPSEIYSAPRSWTEKAYPNLVHYNRLPKGGHFAAWEQTGYYVDEVRATSERCTSNWRSAPFPYSVTFLCPTTSVAGSRTVPGFASRCSSGHQVR